MPPAPPLCAPSPQRAGRARGGHGGIFAEKRRAAARRSGFLEGTGERRGSAPRTRGRRQCPPAPPLCASTPRRAGRTRGGYGGSAYLRKKRRAAARRSGFPGRNEGNVGAPRPEPAAGGSRLLHLRFARPPRGERGGRAGDMGDPHICEKNVGRKPDEAAFWKGSARGNLFLLKEVPPRRSPPSLLCALQKNATPL